MLEVDGKIRTKMSPLRRLLLALALLAAVASACATRSPRTFARNAPDLSANLDLHGSSVDRKLLQGNAIASSVAQVCCNSPRAMAEGVRAGVLCMHVRTPQLLAFWSCPECRKRVSDRHVGLQSHMTAAGPGAVAVDAQPDDEPRCPVHPCRFLTCKPRSRTDPAWQEASV